MCGCLRQGQWSTVTWRLTSLYLPRRRVEVGPGVSFSAFKHVEKSSFDEVFKGVEGGTS